MHHGCSNELLEILRDGIPRHNSDAKVFHQLTEIVLRVAQQHVLSDLSEANACNASLKHDCKGESV
jgi:hypothetical protein